MPHTRIIDVLAEVFQTHGFDTTTPAHPEDEQGRVHRVDLHAEKSGLDVIVAASTGPAGQDPGVLEQHAWIRDAVGARYALLTATHPVADAVRRDAQARGVIVWDADQVASAIGRAVLFEVTGAPDLPIADLLSLAPLHPLPGTVEPGSATPAPGPVEDIPFSDLIHPEPVPTARAATPGGESSDSGRNVESGRGWYLETKDAQPTPEPPTTPAPVTPTATLSAPGARAGIPEHSGRDPHSFTPTEGALLAPGVDKEAAAQRARSEIFTVENTRLRYHPKRLFRWQVEAFVEGQVKTHLLEGTCLVDLATKTLEVPEAWQAPRHLREGTFDVPVDHKPVRMEPEQARELVMAHVLDETAREATMQDDDSAGDFALTVKRRVRVEKDDVRIEDEGLHWCPVWWISGKNGEVEVDALSGAVREKRLQNVPSETILL